MVNSPAPVMLLANTGSPSVSNVPPPALSVIPLVKGLEPVTASVPLSRMMLPAPILLSSATDSVPPPLIVVVPA